MEALGSFSQRRPPGKEYMLSFVLESGVDLLKGGES